MPVETRRERGKALRQQVPRGAHEAIGQVDRDPVALLQLSSEGRVPRLVPLRYGRMVQSPFAFFRGSAILQAHDLAGTPDSGLPMQICGDCHLANFGGFATPERALLFDLNDFDETSPGPWEWDLKRLCASFVVAVRHLRHGPGVAADAVRAAVGSYRRRMADYAGMGMLDTWYDRITFDRLIEEETSPEIQKRIRRGMERAADRTHESLLPKLAERIGERWKILDAPPAVFHVHGRQTLFEAGDDWMTLANPEQAIAQAFKEYLSTLAPDRRRLLEHFTRHDQAFKVVGVGSVGTRCLIQLLVDQHDKPLFLQVKEATRSVVARYYKSAPCAHEGRRVVEGQRLMQAASDLFLGWTKGPRGRHFYMRQLRDMKLSAQIELMDADLLGRYAALCGWVLARAHAKASGLAAEVSGYLGRSDRMADVMVGYANGYADQVERDYDQFVAACRSGRLEARTDADMAADFRV
ncbi:DUF2252 domain-containing protein [Cupriavidus alkaliphilus]|uniref:DUF2252 domain-containing protein n=1 Tax=Cupriavidus alkaliphilus TaxID=942866 RepID=UPI00161BB209|nr:DUF2252 domain-containing protein [Cupriavidus alkaliphilus]MBB2919113.1 uncharacterized protein (DUF2252 family) [Cupriavidus alkaliphilus]